MAVVRSSVRVGIVSAAAALAVTFGAHGYASAEPETTPTTPGTSTTPESSTAPDSSTAPGSSTTPSTPAPDGEAPTLEGIPGDAELTELLRALKQSGGAEEAIGALSSILGSEGQVDPSGMLTSLGINPDALDSILPTSPPTTDQNSQTPAAPGSSSPESAAPTGEPSTSNPGTTNPGTTDPAAPNPVAGSATTPAAGDVIGTLEKLTGAKMLSPAIAPFCAAPTDDNPLGIVTAPAVAVPGPWPAGESSAIAKLLKGSGADSLLKLTDPARSKSLKAVDNGEIAYALVPPAKPDSDNLQVAWFNTSTMQGGMETLKPLEQDKTVGPLLKALATRDGFHGIRLARASTGEGTVLSAVFGTTTTGPRTCYFLPALGAVNN
ncbi:hypothetical protein [Gordonia sp. (in: high G+C Gram-positive bacteria)]|uniref:hypothetical protein n=1 Tax=Gordonia sp. (in: high G+C Gram-positive bacteria) TaxID=84139 RepID=UPI003F99A626